MIKISVIIPSYKPGSYLSDCIESVSHQTLDTGLFEVVIILNGNKEPYYTQIEESIRRYSNMKLIYTPLLGVSNARNEGIDASKGEYLCFIDDDDVISPFYLEGLLKQARVDTISVSNVYSFKYSISECAENFFICKQLRDKKKYTDRSFYRCRSFLAFPVAKMIHRNIISNHRFDTRFTNGEDALFITSITDNLSHIAFASDDIVYYVRERMGSASRRKIGVFKIMFDSLILIKEYIVIYFSNPSKYSLKLFLSRIPGVVKNACFLMKN